MGQNYRPLNHKRGYHSLLSDYVLEQAAGMSNEEVLDLADSLHDLLRSRRLPKAAKQRYAILRAGSEWQIVCSRRRMGHFQSRELAVEAGARLARQAVEAGHEVELLVQEEAGELVTVEPSAAAPGGLRLV